MKERVTETCKQENERREKWRKILRVIKATIATIMTVVLFGIVIAEVTWCHIDKQYFDCRQPNRDYVFTIALKKEYSSHFPYEEVVLGQLLTVEDFKWDNIYRIEYDRAYGIPYDYIDVYLKKAGNIECKLAILHCKKLYFVEDANFYATQRIP